MKKIIIKYIKTKNVYLEVPSELFKDDKLIRKYVESIYGEDDVLFIDTQETEGVNTYATVIERMDTEMEIPDYVAFDIFKDEENVDIERLKIYLEEIEIPIKGILDIIPKYEKMEI